MKDDLVGGAGKDEFQVDQVFAAGAWVNKDKAADFSRSDAYFDA